MRSTALLGERSDGEDILFKLYSRRPFFFGGGSHFHGPVLSFRLFSWAMCVCVCLNGR